jgi:hypothetical protein
MKYLVVVLMAVMLLVFFFMPEQKPLVGEPLTEYDFPRIDIKPVSPNDPYVPKPESVQPIWKKWPRVREVQNPSLGVVLGDIESHMPAGHHYRDANKMTWAHETTHGINANIRNSIQQTRERFNGLYVLQDRAVVLREPGITIQDVAKIVPEALRGPSYKLYLIDQTHSWGDRPLYLMDEWVAYTNGSEAGKELNLYGWYFELLQAHNFNVYCMCMAMCVQRDVSDYNDTEMRKFMMWNIERVFRLSNPSDRDKVVMPENVGPVRVLSEHFICPHPVLEAGSDMDLKVVDEYVRKVRTVPEAEKLRNFAREYFGEEWCKRVYGF